MSAEKESKRGLDIRQWFSLKKKKQSEPESDIVSFMLFIQLIVTVLSFLLLQHHPLCIE
jgi:hypothetical protein